MRFQATHKLVTYLLVLAPGAWLVFSMIGSALRRRTPSSEVRTSAPAHRHAAVHH